jgi:hypothetical protein
VTYEERITSVVVLPEGKPLFDPHATVIKLADEAAGEFLVIQQQAEESSGEIRIDIDEWPKIRRSINKMAKRARLEKKP